MLFKRYAALLLIAATLAVTLAAPAALADKDLPYKVDVDLVNQIVTIFTNDADETIVLQCLCSSGADGATPTGTFKMPEKERPTERTEWFHFRAFGGYARYATRIYHDIMFHSLLYSRPRESRINEQSVKDFGYPVSHGCIRLRVEDAKFIAENCPVGTRVKIHKENEKDEELRNLLYQSSYYAASGQSYSQFLGVPDEPGMLGRGASGEEVVDLQMMLRDLGISDDEIDGKYSLATVRAVREAQALLGVPQTGMADLAFRQAIAAADAPSAMNVKLRHGDSGASVRVLQKGLQALRLYDGDIDGVYDVDVMDAVQTFQDVYGFPLSKNADPMVQKAIYYEGTHVTAVFADDPGYRMEIRDTQNVLGTVNCQVGIKLREGPSTDSKALMSLRNGTTVIGVTYGSEWSQVMKEGTTGYVKNTYMDYRAEPSRTLTYIGSDGRERYSLGIDTYNESPAEAFIAYVEGGGSLEEHEGMAEHAATRVEADLYSNPSQSSEVIATLPQDTSVELLLKSSEWSLVACDGLQGYLLNDAVEFWLASDGSEEEAEDVTVFENDLTESAVIAPGTGDRSQVYESADESSPVLGSLSTGARVSVLETLEGWSLIELDGHQGYVKEKDLKFTTT